MSTRKTATPHPLPPPTCSNMSLKTWQRKNWTYVKMLSVSSLFLATPVSIGKLIPIPTDAYHHITSYYEVLYRSFLDNDSPPNALRASFEREMISWRPFLQSLPIAKYKMGLKSFKFGRVSRHFTQLFLYRDSSNADKFKALPKSRIVPKDPPLSIPLKVYAR